MQQKFDTDDQIKGLHLKVIRVIVANQSGNQYTGVATVRTPIGKERDIPVQVTSDGHAMVWQTPPGALLFPVEDIGTGSPVSAGS